ncbi:hypothetical protein PTSG_02083 [Salpingoeca rosetta]|uniref:ATP-grasp domain-containing protein n=1 Tax=Salpingoeca rosetta (strain ATCC 50818 / BSB-021) TaxID=946362 RepID=F2U2K9_SALR5|nr:uncharacterized protein PTSG_02083 [Salpingoeca rosetta]EGD81364.1 hypothetical protein PTSG_02083 [Salpingoeca rosetta]|eukprot:XP_004996568.1 hypothetical protein PTSG_02083 [Salpingoeca rosetta]
MTSEEAREGRVVFITATSGTSDDNETPLLMKLLKEKHGVDAVNLAWDTPDVFEHWTQRDVGIVKSPWNYHLKYDEFVAFLDEVERRNLVIHNSLSVLRSNIHKGYLTKLEEKGIPTIPTAHYSRGTKHSVADLVEQRGWSDVVIKPAVGASSFKTKHFRAADHEAAQAHLDALLADRDAMVQKFMHSIRTRGETSLIWFDGALSHAVHKRATFEGDQLHFPEHSAAPTEVERAFVDRVLATQPPCLYARIDIMQDDDGSIRLSELELTEPYLYLPIHPGASEAYAAAIARTLQRHTAATATTTSTAQAVDSKQ